MATFTISGYEIFSEAAREVSDIKAAQLQIVSPLGQATLDFSYASDDPKSAEVSLSDYNLIMNGLHLNDGVLPERIELFNLTWDTETHSDSSHVINLAYADGTGWRDCIFAVGNSPLPDLTDPEQVTNMLNTAQFSVIEKSEMEQGFQIQLGDMPGVSVDGVIHQLFEDEANDRPDMFQFFQPSDVEGPDVTEFDIVARAQEPDMKEGPAEEIWTEDAGTMEVTSYDDFGG